jgi:hypothetical protein
MKIGLFFIMNKQKFVFIFLATEYKAFYKKLRKGGW